MLKLTDFKKVQIDNERVIKGGGNYTTLDGVVRGDFTDGDRFFVRIPNGNYVENP